MSRWYEVKITTSMIALVEVEEADEGDARNAAIQVAYEEFVPLDGVSETEIDGGPYAPDSPELASAKRHADEVLSLPESEDTP